MKLLRLTFLLFFIPITFHAHKSLTGLWTGKMTNDSLTVRQDQSFEIALTEYRGKVYGYSRSTFIVNDTLYYIMKRVKGTIEGEICEIKDDEIISYNFRGKIDKGVKVTTVFRMNKQDSTWFLAGDWNTNKTKKYYSISGKVDLKEEPDLEKSKIFPHLEELNLAKEVPFYAESKKPVTTVPEKSVAINTKKEAPVKKAEPPATKPQTKVSEPVAINTNEPKKAEPSTTKPQTKISEPVAVNTNESKKTEPPATQPQTKVSEPVAVTTNESKKTETPTTVTKPAEEKNNTQPIASEIKKQEPPVAVITTEQKKPEAIRPETKKTDAPVVVRKPEIIIPVAAAMVKERKTPPPQEVSFVSDSLELSLYDNGEVDGDTVSVLMNGEIILANQGLKTSAIKKTIYMKPGQDEITIVLYAENLGKYPPNTGLLVVHDGEERYQIRFSADLQQNASVIFRRKRK